MKDAVVAALFWVGVLSTTALAVNAFAAPMLSFHIGNGAAEPGVIGIDGVGLD
jgi:hypothetical protein